MTRRSLLPAALDPRTVLLLAGLSVGVFAAELAETVFATALPTMLADLGGLGQMPWVTTAYLVAATLAMPLAGKLSDLVGRRRLFGLGVSVFLLGSLLGGAAPTMSVLVAARAVQGLGGGGLLIVLQSVVADRVPLRERAGVMSVVGAVFALAALAGPPLGGWLADGIGWRWAFWLNLPLGLAALAAATLLPRGQRREAPLRVDLRGAGALTLAVLGLVVLAGLAGRASVPLLLLIGGGTALALAALLWVEHRAVEPLIPLRLFRNRVFRVVVLPGAALGLAAFGAVGYLPIYLHVLTGASSTTVGLMMLGLVAGMALATVLAAQVARRAGRFRELVIAGGALTAAGLTGLAALPPDTADVLVVATLFLLGAGIGSSWEIIVVVAQSAAGAVNVGVATSTNAVTREVGVCVGSAVVGGWFAARLGPLPAAGASDAVFASAGAPVFLMLAAVAVLAALAFRSLPSTLACGPGAPEARVSPRPGATRSRR